MKRLNFGCGNDIREGWDNCDIQREAPISFDFDKFPYKKLKNNYYDYVLIFAVLENLSYPDKALYELREKCKKGAIIEITTPYWNNKGVWNNPESKRAFNEMSFKNIAYRCYNHIDNAPRFEIIEINLIPTRFGRWIPKIIREKIGIIFGGIIMQMKVKLKVINK